jgi:hypothetical protein
VNCELAFCPASQKFALHYSPITLHFSPVQSAPITSLDLPERKKLRGGKVEGGKPVGDGVEST